MKNIVLVFVLLSSISSYAGAYKRVKGKFVSYDTKNLTLQVNNKKIVYPLSYLNLDDYNNRHKLVGTEIQLSVPLVKKKNNL